LPDYIDLAITADAATLYEDGVEAIETLAPDGWTPSPAEEWILAATARMGAEIAVLAGHVPLAIFTYLGQSILDIPTLEPAHASGTVTFALTDAVGHVIPAGTQIAIDDVGFETALDLTIPAGQSAGQTVVQAIDTGTAANALTGTTVQLISPAYTWVDSVTLDAPTGGGDDGEDPNAYADRITDELPTLSPKAILIGDFEALARRNPLVGRALALNRYDPGPPVSDEADGHVTVAVHDVNGEPLSALTRADIAAELEANRVLNLVVHVVDPTYTSVDVAFTATAYPGYSPDVVRDAALTAIDEFLNPASWGRAPTTAVAIDWIEETTLRRNDVIGVLYDVDGLRHVLSLELAIAGETLGTDDVELAAPAALPRIGSVDGTVT